MKRYGKVAAAVLVAISFPIWVLPFGLYCMLRTFYRAAYEAMWGEE